MKDKQKLSDREISVVIPVHNSEDCLTELTRRLTQVLDSFGKSYEIILVNDGSSDNSWEKTAELSEIYDKLKGINLRRNFGQNIVRHLKNQLFSHVGIGPSET